MIKLAIRPPTTTIAKGCCESEPMAVGRSRISAIPQRRVHRSPALIYFLPLGGSSSVVERQLPKLNVAGSIPVSRSRF